VYPVDPPQVPSGETTSVDVLFVLDIVEVEDEEHVPNFPVVSQKVIVGLNGG
jgi:hypothetical protein